MYTPQQQTGLKVEYLFDETLILVSHPDDKYWPNERYVYVDWGPGFYAEHANLFPELERPALSANIGWLAVQLVLAQGGSCFLPARIAQPWLQTGQLIQLKNTPVLKLPAYVVYPQQTAGGDGDIAVKLLRGLVKESQL